MLTSVPRGTKDILPSEVGAWRYVEGVLRNLCRCFGFKEIRASGKYGLGRAGVH